MSFVRKLNIFVYEKLQQFCGEAELQTQSQFIVVLLTTAVGGDGIDKYL